MTDQKKQRLIEAVLTIAGRLPKFMIMADEEIQDLAELLDTKETNLFKEVVGVTLSQFKELLDVGYLRRDKLNRLIERLYCTMKNAGPMDAIEIIANTN